MCLHRYRPLTAIKADLPHRSPHSTHHFAYAPTTTTFFPSPSHSRTRGNAMAERFPGDKAAANGFGRRWLHDWEACPMQEANYPTPPDMCVSGAWWMSVDCVLVPPPPSDVYRPDDIEAIQASLPEDACHQARSFSMPRRMDPSASSSSGSRSSETAAPFVPIKPEPHETPLHRRSRNGNLVINGDRVPSPPRDHICLVKPRKDPTVVVKKENEDMAADLESGLAWSCADYVKKEMKRRLPGLEEMAERRRGCNEGDVIVLSHNDEEVVASSKPIRNGDPRQGCNKDAPKDGPLSNCDDDDGGDEYTVFYNLLAMN
ncbi:hypothetical protein D1007_35038 [Hordeum vulgare]|nr:hypothetical protein D1007_35038 [Hordeum vulgare]